MEFTILNPGMNFEDSFGTSLRVIENNSGMVFYEIKHLDLRETHTLGEDILLTALNRSGQWKLVTETPIDTTGCKHTNITKEFYFSKNPYLTCKDCGKPLN